MARFLLSIGTLAMMVGCSFMAAQNPPSPKCERTYYEWRSPFPDEYRWMLERQKVWDARSGCYDQK